MLYEVITAGVDAAGEGYTRESGIEGPGSVLVEAVRKAGIVFRPAAFREKGDGAVEPGGKVGLKARGSREVLV